MNLGFFNSIPEDKPMKITIVTTASNGRFKLASSSSSSYKKNCIVDWGDGEIETFRDGYYKYHYYDVAGTYQVKIYGQLDYIDLKNASYSNSHLDSIDSWGTLFPTTLIASYLVYNTSLPEEPGALRNLDEAYEIFYYNKLLAKIPDGLFSKNIKATDYRRGFMNSVFSDTFPALVIGKEIFKDCASNLLLGDLFNKKTIDSAALSEDAFKDADVESFNNLFKDSDLSSIPENLFATNVNAKDFSYMLSGASVTTIPAGLFTNNVNAIDFSGCIGHDFTALPETLFNTNVLAEKFDELIASNTSLTTIPVNLFINNPNVISFVGFAANNNTTTIPNGIFDNCPLATDFTRCFAGTNREPQVGLISNTNGTIFDYIYYAHEITSLPAGFFPDTAESFELAFGNVNAWGMDKLVTVDAGAFDNCVNATNFKETFKYNVNLANLPTGMFNKCIHATTFENTFMYCSSLQSVPDNCFDNLEDITILDRTFNACNIKTLPLNSFNNMPALKELYMTLGQSSLTTIQKEFFDQFVSLDKVSYIFSGDDSLTTIPSDIFTSASLSNVKELSGIFNDCDNITSIPSGIFSSNTEVISLANMFSSMDSLTSVPSDVFSANTKVEIFDYVFSRTPLATIPAGLFDNNTAALSFKNSFYYGEMSEVPNNLFANCTLATNFDYAFYSCGPELTTIGTNVFPASANRFYNTFYYNYGITGALPELWNSHPTAYGNDCFRSCTNASNYGDVPYAWR